MLNKRNTIFPRQDNTETPPTQVMESLLLGTATSDNDLASTRPLSLTLGTTKPGAVPTGTAGVETLLARRITLPPTTLATVVAVAVIFFVSVGTAIAYCLRKTTGNRGDNFDDRENGKVRSTGVHVRKRPVVNTKNLKSVKPVEIQVNVEILGPTFTPSKSQDEGDSYNKTTKTPATFVSKIPLFPTVCSKT